MDEDELRASWERMYQEWAGIIETLPQLVQTHVEGDLDSFAPVLLIGPFFLELP